MSKALTIMLLDDDEDDQMIFSNVITEIDSDIVCRCFSDPLVGLQTLETSSDDKPDCIFLDLNLPKMHGFEFLKIIKASTELNIIPVIMYSTSSRETDIIKARDLGASSFLIKSDSLSDLKLNVVNLLASVCKRGN